MIPIRTRVIDRPPTAAKIVKNINFGAARGLTRVAKDGQSAVLGSLKTNFTLRGTWFQQQNRMGIKVKPAKPNDLSAEVRTRAHWLIPHETGTDKVARGSRITVPTWKVRPKGSTKRITSAMRARRLLAAGKAFIMKTDRGEVIATHGVRKGLSILYGLERRVRIRKRSTFNEPITKVTRRKGQQTLMRSIADALRTMR